MRFHHLTATLCALSLGAFAQTKVAQNCVDSGVCFKLNIPQVTAQNGAGNIFLSLSGPSTYSWIALGMGSSMTNSNMFVMYADGTGNVTVSPRFSQGHRQPQLDQSLDVELLGGSGIQNGIMTANIRCGNCTRNGANFAAQSGQWIHARKSGQSMDTTDAQARIMMHDVQDGFTWTYPDAVGGASANPFATSNTVVSNSLGNSNGSSGGNSNILMAHGVLASLAFLVFFPLGAIIMRIGRFNGVLQAHIATQVLSWLLFVTAFGLGLYYGINGKYMSQAHPIIGIVLLAMLVFQPFAGWLHHRQFLRSGQRSAVSHGHIWTGRIAIILGMINGGLGLQLASVETRYVIAYSVVAGVMGLAYIAATVWGEITRSRRTSVTPSEAEKIRSSPERSSVVA
ncbi:hypothetical protein E8E13_009037 [Curvularia kusanoi]|uniref:Cytochrome b561 domain-containing protein n=1 Tax=Curvularia kusanoi TaxID=90978 RepID=A0A9P4TLU9_CURKU|nr:hypothetical protein E8E13_009037 [Curvularia kusanoi]